MEMFLGEKSALEETIVRTLIQKHLKITTAESCTGGLLAGRLLDIAGASEVYEEGYITYSDASKAKLLGVKKKRWKNIVQSVKKRLRRW